MDTSEKKSKRNYTRKGKGKQSYLAQSLAHKTVGQQYENEMRAALHNAALQGNVPTYNQYRAALQKIMKENNQRQRDINELVFEDQYTVPKGKGKKSLKGGMIPGRKYAAAADKDSLVLEQKQKQAKLRQTIIDTFRELRDALNKDVAIQTLYGLYPKQTVNEALISIGEMSRD